MKLCRFELKSEPGIARSGMLYGGKIYETSGAEAIAAHEADVVRPLAPIPHSPSVRVFLSNYQPGIIAGMEAEEPNYFYGNPTALVGASMVLPFPELIGEVGVESFLAAVVVSDGYQIPLELADDVILGYTLIMLIVGRTAEAAERRVGAVGRSYDFGGVVGPVVTTPDELDEQLTSDEFGRRFNLESVMRVNGVERARGNADLLPFTAAQAISSASNSTPIRAGDLIAIGPIAQPEAPISLASGDEVQLAVDRIGMLSLKLG